MALESGTRFGSYKVAEQIGAGGMGEVWRATDTELGRDVAIKVLPQAFIDDADRMARFKREAELLASLNHPNIATIHGLEKSGDQTVIVMELVEGPTLADRIKAGPLAPDEAMGIALQVVAALEAAHEKQIVHRDLKPANVKVKDDGTVKVLDFGISKPIDPAAISGGSPVMTTPAVTQTGVILGTAAYMSPEQARGKFVDQRTDIWAFGCLLFEMLTGQPAFGGEDVMLTLARVLANETSLDSIPSTISPAVRHTLKLCLEKDPRKRIHHIGDVRLALEGIFESGLPQPAETAAAQPVLRRVLPAAVGVLAAGVVMGLAVWALWPEPAVPPISRFAQPAEGETIAVSVSANGTHFAYSDGQQIFVRTLDAFEFEPVNGANGGNPLDPACFSPDASWIAYSSRTQLLRIPVTGGGSLPLVEGLTGPSFCHWGDDNHIYFVDDRSIKRIASSGGDIETLVDAEVMDNRGPVMPTLLPGGDAVLFSLPSTNVLGADTTIDIAMLDLATGDVAIVQENAGLAEFVPRAPESSQGHLVYGRDGSIFASAFDIETRIAGAPRPVAGGIVSLGPAAILHTSRTGTLVYVGGRQIILAPRVMTWFDRDGNQTVVDSVQRSVVNGYELSPDNDRAVMTLVNTDDTLSLDLWVFEFDGGRITPLTRDGNSVSPVWLSDGERVIYANTVVDESGEQVRVLILRRADNAGTATTLVSWQGTLNYAPLAVSPDDSVLIGTVTRPNGSADIWSLPLTPDTGEPATEDAFEYLLESEFREAHASFSPDGQYIAYTSLRSGQAEVYVEPYPQTGQSVPISVDGGRMPRWNPAGGELFFVSGNRMMAVEIDTGSEFERSEPTVLFTWPELEDSLGTANISTYDVSSDGLRFLLPTDTSVTANNELRIVLNWAQELAELAPLE